MKSYIVGGAVRDRLLGLPVQDRDHVVVGATVDEMLAAGFTPVGRDFPVFLHPETHEEYALARTERKVAPGYAGFVFHAAPEVSLEDDLARRDLTINAMAEDETTGAIIDPFDGRADLEQRRFRHIGPAFVEDPVRILRLARFSARFTDFHTAPDTDTLMRTMVERGEVDALVPERVWQELARGLMEAMPSRMVALLQRIGALARIVPGLDVEAGSRSTAHYHAALDRSAASELPLAARAAIFLCPMFEAGSAGAVGNACQRLGMPRTLRETCELVAATSPRFVKDTGIGEVIALLERMDAFRRPTRASDAIAALGAWRDDQRTEERWRRALDAASGVDGGAVARSVSYEPARVKVAVHGARVDAARAALGDEGEEGDRFGLSDTAC